MELTTWAIFVAGLATFASPCVLPIIPIYLSVLTGGAADLSAPGLRGRFSLLANGLMFVLGFSLVFLLLGLTASAVGRFFLAHRLLLQQLGGLLVFVFGLKFLGWLRIEALEREKRWQLAGQRKMSPLTASLMGFTFAFGWTPCIGPVLGAVLTFTAVSTTSTSQGAVNLLAYAAGIGLPLLVVAALAQPGLLMLRRLNQFLPRIERATGVLLVAMAVLMVTDNVAFLTFGGSETTSAEISRSLSEHTSAPAREGRDGLPPSAAREPDDTEAYVCQDEVCVLDLPSAGDPVAPTAPRERPRVIYFHSPNCPACLRMTPIVRAMGRDCEARGLDVERVDVQTPAGRHKGARHRVVGTPTLVFISAADQEVTRLVGASSLGAVNTALSVLVGERCADFSPFDH